MSIFQSFRWGFFFCCFFHQIQYHNSQANWNNVSGLLQVEVYLSREWFASRFVHKGFVQSWFVQSRFRLCSNFGPNALSGGDFEPSPMKPGAIVHQICAIVHQITILSSSSTLSHLKQYSTYSNKLNITTCAQWRSSPPSSPWYAIFTELRECMYNCTMYMLCIVINLIGAAFKVGAMRFSIALIKQRHRGIYIRFHCKTLLNPIEVFVQCTCTALPFRQCLGRLGL